MTVTVATPSSIAAKKLLILYPSTALKRNFCYNSSINLTSSYRPVSFGLASGPNYRACKEIGQALFKSRKQLETTEIEKEALPHYYMTGTVCPVRNPHFPPIELVFEIPINIIRISPSEADKLLLAARRLHQWHHNSLSKRRYGGRYYHYRIQPHETQ